MELTRVNKGYRNVHPIERWACLIGGAWMAVNGIRRGTTGGALQIVGGALLAKRGLTGRCELYQALGLRSAPRPESGAMPYELGIRARAAVTVNAERRDVFNFWRQLDNLPLFMKNVESVTTADRRRYHWVVRGIGDRKVSWDADIINEIPNELIAWKSLPGGDVESAGSVRFKDAPGGRGTEIRVQMQYDPPGGAVGAYIARLFGREAEQQVVADLIRLKQYLEGGELAKTTGQPHADPKRGPFRMPTLEQVTA